MEASPCKHFQTGYCKFCEHCKKNSISMKCVRQKTVLQVIAHRGTERCANTSTPIVDFMIFFCYKHVTINRQNENTELVAKVTRIEECIKINVLENC